MYKSKTDPPHTWVLLTGICSVCVGLFLEGCFKLLFCLLLSLCYLYSFSLVVKRFLLQMRECQTTGFTCICHAWQENWMSVLPGLVQGSMLRPKTQPASVPRPRYSQHVLISISDTRDVQMAAKTWKVTNVFEYY